jgi:hypothetical protein
VLTALAEGLDVAAAVRVFGHNLHLPHLLVDELRTRLRHRARVFWLWVVVDPISKIIPVLKEGARTQDAAHSA